LKRRPVTSQSQALDAPALGLAASARPSVDWRAFYDEHWPFVHRVVRRFAGSGVDVEDVVQDVFLVLVRSLGEFEGRSSLTTWMYRICLNVASEHRRRAGRRIRLRQAVERVGFWRSERTALDELSAKDALSRLNRILARLSPKRRDAFVLCELEELSADEAARVLGIPPATVRTRLHHARRDFERFLARHGAAS